MNLWFVIKLHQRKKKLQKQQQITNCICWFGLVWLKANENGAVAWFFAVSFKTRTFYNN